MLHEIVHIRPYLAVPGIRQIMLRQTTARIGHGDGPDLRVSNSFATYFKAKVPPVVVQTFVAED